MTNALIASMALVSSNNFRALARVTPEEGKEDHKHAHMLRNTAWSGRPNTSAESSSARNEESKDRKWLF